MEFVILFLTVIILFYSAINILKIIEGYETDSKPLIFTLFIYSILVLFLSVSFIIKPKAIDVYKGKTTLEITYQDKIPIDSTVVWKNK